jgi:galactokinase
METQPIKTIAPGRVNLLGEHVDYNAGPVLPAAIDRAVRLTAYPRHDALLELHALDLGETVQVDLQNLDMRQDVHAQPLPRWALYPAGVAWALQKHGFEPRGMLASFTSDIPIGAGLSSSAAIEMAFATAWRASGGWQVDTMTLALYALMAENQYAGLNCGLLDQFASGMGVAGAAVYLDTRSLAWEAIPLPAGTAIIIADSGIHHDLVNSEYNLRRADCEIAVAMLKANLPGIQALRDVTPEQFTQYGGSLPPKVRIHAQHVVEECARVDAAVPLLKAGNIAEFGKLVSACHASLRDLYEVSLPEIDRLVELALALPGCWGARLTGGGFGGCTVNLVEESQAAVFIQRLKAGYFASTGRDTPIYLCHASRGAHIVTD